MAITEVACCIAKCDRCGDGWQHEDLEGTPHFTDRVEALMHLIGLPPTGDADTDEEQNEENWGWTLTSVDGQETLLCKVCTAERFCAANGHDWGEWHDCYCGGTSVRHQPGFTSKWRSCMRLHCNALEDADTVGTCEERPEPLPQSRGALLVTQRRHYVMYLSLRPNFPGADEPHEVPPQVAGLVADAAEIVGRIDALLPAEYVVP